MCNILVELRNLCQVSGPDITLFTCDKGDSVSDIDIIHRLLSTIVYIP